LIICVNGEYLFGFVLDPTVEPIFRLISQGFDELFFCAMCIYIYVFFF